MPKAKIPVKGELLDSWGRRNRKLAFKRCQRCAKVFKPYRAESKYCSRPCLWAGNGGQNKKPESWWTDSKGYIQGRIWLDGKQIRVKKHRWIMEQHLGRPLSLNEDVHHINGVKADNRLSNLELIEHGQHSIITNKNRWSRAAIAKAEGRDGK